MPDLTINHRWWHRIIQKVAASAFGSWLLTENLQRIDKPLLHLTNNRVSFTSLLAGLPVIVLHTIGAKTGLPRQTPLVAHSDGEKIILIASYFGKSCHPSWYYNLKANPEVKVSLNGYSADHIARLSSGEERELYWQQAVSLYHGYRRYEQQAGNREIPVVVLEPR
jgi:deazaflavin-dependent oxidoreductase (nitroreductase family)